jgi:hypothetical protein
MRMIPAGLIVAGGSKQAPGVISGITERILMRLGGVGNPSISIA